jgi:hypothetical protein
MTPITTIEAFERHHHVTLPAEYREYLLLHGCAPTPRVSSLDDWCQPYTEHEVGDAFLSRPFPHRQPWNDAALLAQATNWSSSYYAKGLFCGALRFGNLGDEEYALLVISGPERGHVWIDARVSRRAGIYPLAGIEGRRVCFRAYLDHPTAAR